MKLMKVVTRDTGTVGFLLDWIGLILDRVAGRMLLTVLRHGRHCLRFSVHGEVG